jgi:uncharacterized protein (TIRG00374 family)
MKILAEILAIAVVWLLVRRFAPQSVRGAIVNALKAWVTVRAFWLLLAHPVKLEDGSKVVAWKLIVDQMKSIDARTFWTFVAAATGIKFLGILSSMWRWRLLLAGQGIELPFRHIFGSFLIGRFIGTFLPSTAGLDGYKLFDAARFSGRTVEATAATALEKVLGVSGIFLSFLVALPFGIKIFGDKAGIVAAITVPISLAIILGLLALLWFPGIVQWLLDALPLPGKARLEILVMRISRSTAAYRDKKPLVLAALFLSFLVHFTTAAMYYFTALAVGAGAKAEFWPLVFGSSIQIFATVLAPTMGGVGAREWAQLVTLGHMIGPAAAIVSAALGFWAAEGLTLFGGIFWWVRGASYRPAYCRVDGHQVDYDEAARNATALLPDAEPSAAAAGAVAPLPPLARRLLVSGLYGLGAGLVAGVLLGAAEAFVIARGGFGGDAQVVWFGPLAYAVVLGLGGLAGGVVLGALPMDEREIRGWTPSLAWLALLVPLALAITVFRVRRDVYLEQAIPMPVLAAILGGAALAALLLFFVGRRVFAGPLGALVRPLPALALLALAVVAGAVASPRLVPPPAAPPTPPPAPAALAEQPNLILVMVDTLRADQLDCYGGPVSAPNLCRLARDGGTAYLGFSSASWTKPSAASLLTGMLPSSHGAMSKIASLSPSAVLVSEALKEHGYATGGVVTNINLAPSFGFDQGWDEYTYLAPDYLAGAKESSSKLILYQIARKVWFKLRPGHRVGDYYQNAETVNGHAFDFLERHRASRFFLFVHYMDPHDPYFEHPYDGRAIARVEADHPDPKLAPEMLRLYQGEIRYLDAEFGKLLAKLEQLGLYDDSIIVFTADHGEEFFEHGGFWHGLTLYEDQIHIPLLVKWRKGHREAPERVEDHLARQIDVAPTLVARAGAAVPDTMQGVDLLAPWESRSEKDQLVFAEEDHEGNVLRALRTLDWKWLEANADNPRGLPTQELFEIARDPGERNDMVSQRPEIAAELRAKADAKVQFAKSRTVEGGGTALLSQSECEALKALGYVQDCESAKP